MSSGRFRKGGSAESRHVGPDGVRQVAADANAIVVMLAYMPFVTAEMIATLVARYRATAALLVASHYGEVQAPPTLYARALFAELLSIPGEQCAKEVVRRHEQGRPWWPGRIRRCGTSTSPRTMRVSAPT